MRAGGSDRRLERLGDLLGPALERMGPRTLWTEAKIRRAWAAVVGDEVAAHARVRRLRNTTLLVDVSSDVWATELRYLARTIVERLARVVGDGTVTEIVVAKARQGGDARGR